MREVTPGFWLAVCALMALASPALAAERAVPGSRTPTATVNPSMPLAVPVIGGSAALLLVLTDDDEELSRLVSRNRNDEAHDIALFGKAFGEVPLNFGILSTVGAYGWFTGDLTAVDCARGGLAAAALATGLVVPALKVAFGRFRPNSGRGSHDFDPVDGPGRSFPSGHTALAFSLAGTINSFYPGWAGTLAIGLATTTAYSRVYTRNHWASDVLVGGIIGYGTATVVASAFRRSLGQGVVVSPAVSRDYTGATISGRF